VLAVDLQRRRIGLSMRLDAPVEEAPAYNRPKAPGQKAAGQKAAPGSRRHRSGAADRQRAEQAPQSALAAAFETARRR
jgi:Transcriptional accessory protein